MYIYRLNDTFEREQRISDLSDVLPPWFRSLYENIINYDGMHFYAELLAPWLKEHSSRAAEWFAMISERPGEPYPSLTSEDLWVLYAFSRVDDALRLDFQPDRLECDLPEGRREWPCLRVDDYQNFVEGCGLKVCPPASTFTPFLHEIVTVEQSSNESEQIELAHEFWPAVMAGNLLISRAGTCITAGRTHIVKEVAENSTLYWSYLRRNRRCNDLSLGWGSNSQWRTEFRRDYNVSGMIYLNVDAPEDKDMIDVDEEPLTKRQRFELLVHRCLVTESRPDENDLWPYYEEYSGSLESLTATGAYL